MNFNIDKETVNELLKKVDIQTLVAEHVQTMITLAPGVAVEVTLNDDGTATAKLVAAHKPEVVPSIQTKLAAKAKVVKEEKNESVEPKSSEPKPTLKNNPLFKDGSDDEVVTEEKPKGFNFGNLKTPKND